MRKKLHSLEVFDSCKVLIPQSFFLSFFLSFFIIMIMIIIIIIIIIITIIIIIIIIIIIKIICGCIEIINMHDIIVIIA